MGDIDQPRQDRYREQLLESRKELSRRLDALRRDTGTALNKDSGEQATELENRDVMLRLGDEAIAELADIERALARMDAGKYGICARCGETIAPKRLDAYPAATRCIGCASA